MPQGKGTYGSKVGRPPKKGGKMGGKKGSISAKLSKIKTRKK